MLAPRYLDGLSDEIAEIYSQLETDILQDMARRLARLRGVTDATEWQARMLSEAGGLKRNIARILAGYDRTIVGQVTAIFTGALETNARNDNRIFKEATGRTVSDSNAQAMLSTIQKCHSDLSRLTLTTASTTQAQFVAQANRVYMMTQSGAFDYDTAMMDAADRLADEGIRVVQYENGKPVRRSVESAVRMNILTSVSQTAANQTLNNAEELGAELFEVSAHIGARPEHEAWQGKIFTKKQLYSVCGLGTATGLCGINCRHSFYPYFDGMKAHYGADDLDEMAGEKVRFTGSDGVEHELTRYEGEQKLRGIERKIRYYKKKALVRRSAGVDDTAARRKLGEWQAVARDFVRQTGIARDYAREYVGVSRSLWNPMGEQPRGSKGTKEKYVKTAKDTSIQTASDIKKDDDIVDYFVNKYNADTNNRLAFMDVDSVKAFNKGFEDMQKELGVNIPLNSVSTTKGGIASYAYGGKLNFNTNDFATKEALKKIIEEEIKSGYFGKDTTPEILGRHELVHSVEEILIRKRYKTEIEREKAWDDCTIANEILEKAYQNLKAMGETRSKKELLKEISGYAAADDSEGLAECLARKSNVKTTLAYQVLKVTIDTLRRK